MESNTATTSWRKSDTRLVNQAFATFTIIVVLGLVIAGLYFLTPQNTQILGSKTSSSSGK